MKASKTMYNDDERMVAHCQNCGDILLPLGDDNEFECSCGVWEFDEGENNYIFIR